MDPLILRDRVANTISLGESHFREFKSAFDGRPEQKRPRLAKHICADIAEALVAFANADGGDLLWRVTRGSRRMSLQKRIGASEQTSEPEKSAIDRIEPHSSPCTKRRNSSSPTGLPRTAATNRRHAKPRVSFRWPR